MRLRFKRSHCRHQYNKKTSKKYKKKNTKIRVQDITNFKILSASKALLVAYKEWGGKHYFAVHPKGNGVIVHPKLTEGIPRGTYVNSYVGELYPPWLWERKEAEAEKKRRQKMKEEWRQNYSTGILEY